MQAWRSELSTAVAESALTTFPNRWGITTVQPSATTSSENAITSSVMPGISEITTTPGPDPLRYVGWVTPLAVCWPSSQPSMALTRRQYPGIRHRPARRLGPDHSVTDGAAVTRHSHR